MKAGEEKIMHDIVTASTDSYFMNRSSVKSGIVKIILSIFILMAFTSCGGENVPRVCRGVIDLRSFDFTGDSVLSLTGMWDFFWEKFIVTDGLDPSHCAPDGFIAIPGTWRGYSLNKRKLPARGFASYRVTILLPPVKHEYSIYLLFAISSSRVYAVHEDGSIQVLGQAGDPGRSEEETRPLMGPVMARFEAADRITIVYEVADYGTNIGGLWSAPSIGFTDSLARDVLNTKFREFFIIGALVVFGIFHLLLFMLRRWEKAPLWLGLYCLLIALLSTTYGSLRFFEEMFPHADCFEVLNKISFLCIYIGFPVFLTFYHSAFPRYFKGRVIYLVWIISGLLTVPVLLLKSYYFYWTLFIYHAHIFVFGLWFTVMMVRGYYNDRSRLAFVSFTGLFVIFIAAVNDILMVHRVVNTGLYSAYGLFFLVLTQGYVVAAHNAQARRRMERLWNQLLLKSGELEAANLMLTDLNQNLEHKVDERTRELQYAKEEVEAAMEELESVNEHLITTNSRLEHAQRTIRMDMTMAANVQRSFFIKESPHVEKWDIAFLCRPMSDVSGDFYDFYVEDEKLLGASLFDVSGHGVASGLITMIGKSLAANIFMKNREHDAAEIMDEFNRNLIREIGATDNYLTGVMLKFTGNTVEYANAAHPDMLVKIAETGSVGEIEKTDHPHSGGFLGIPIMKNKFEMTRLEVKAGDALLVYSDCLIENKNSNGEPYGLDRLLRVFRSAGHEAGAAEQLEYIMKDFYDFLDEDSLTDDLTVLLMKKTG